MKNSLYKTFIFSILFLFPFFISAQETPNQESSPQTKAQRAQEKKKWKRERKMKFEEKKILKDHKKIQTKAVQKRMRRNKKKSERINGNKREFFLKRWLIRK